MVLWASQEAIENLVWMEKAGETSSPARRLTGLTFYQEFGGPQQANLSGGR